MAVSLSDIPCLDPVALADACRKAGVPAPWLGRANRYACPLGLSPGTATVLLVRRDWLTLDPYAGHTLAFDDGNGNSVEIADLRVTRAEVAMSGARGDPNAALVLELSDRRIDCGHALCPQSYNVRPAPNAGYDADTLDGTGTPWTWATLCQDLWQVVGVLGAWPGLPRTPAGSPEGWEVYGESAADALEDVLAVADMAVSYDPIAGTFSVVRTDVDDTTAADDRLAHDGERLHDGEFFSPDSPPVPAYVRVFFPAWGESDEPQPETVYAVDVADPTPGLATVANTIAPVWDSLPARLDGAGSAVPLNRSALVARAADVAAGYFARLRSSAGEHRVYTGAMSGPGFVPSVSCEAVAWEDVGDGVKTEIACGRRPGLGPIYAPSGWPPAAPLTAGQLSRLAEMAGGTVTHDTNLDVYRPAARPAALPAVAGDATGPAARAGGLPAGMASGGGGGGDMARLLGRPWGQSYVRGGAGRAGLWRLPGRDAAGDPRAGRPGREGYERRPRRRSVADPGDVLLPVRVFASSCGSGGATTGPTTLWLPPEYLRGDRPCGGGPSPVIAPGSGDPCAGGPVTDCYDASALPRGWTLTTPSPGTFGGAAPCPDLSGTWTLRWVQGCLWNTYETVDLAALKVGAGAVPAWELRHDGERWVLSSWDGAGYGMARGATLDATGGVNVFGRLRSGRTCTNDAPALHLAAACPATGTTTAADPCCADGTALDVMVSQCGAKRVVRAVTLPPGASVGPERCLDPELNCCPPGTPPPPSGGVTCACPSCPGGVPMQFALAVPSISAGTFGCCGAFAGDYLLTWASGCEWRSASPASDAFTPVWRLTFDGTVWKLTCFNLSLAVEYRSSATADCFGARTLSRYSASADCTGWPATLTVTPAGDVSGRCGPGSGSGSGVTYDCPQCHGCPSTPCHLCLTLAYTTAGATACGWSKCDGVSTTADLTYSSWLGAWLPPGVLTYTTDVLGLWCRDYAPLVGGDPNYVVQAVTGRVACGEFTAEATYLPQQVLEYHCSPFRLVVQVGRYLTVTAAAGTCGPGSGSGSGGGPLCPPTTHTTLYVTHAPWAALGLGSCVLSGFGSHFTGNSGATPISCGSCGVVLSFDLSCTSDGWVLSVGVVVDGTPGGSTARLTASSSPSSPWGPSFAFPSTGAPFGSPNPLAPCGTGCTLFDPAYPILVSE